MKITVSVHGRYHAFELAKGLHQRKHLDQLLTTYPRFIARKFVGPNALIKSAAVLELKRQVYSKFGIGGKPDLSISKSFGQFSQRQLNSDTDIFVGWSSASLEAIKPAQGFGTKVIIERGSTHISAQTDVLRDAYKQFGLFFNETKVEMIEREEQEYALADKIFVPSKYAAQTFIDRGITADKIIVNGMGVDFEMFQAPSSRSLDRMPRIVFAGGVGIRKGVPWLLKAFKRLSSKAELHLIGPVSPDYEKMLRKEIGANVFVRGALPGHDLSSEYGRGDIFCLPSLEEGYGMVIPQAMACGLPVVTTNVVGAADLLQHAHNGLIVSPADSTALSDALERLIDDVDLRQTMGAYAQTTVQQGQGWDDYVSRAVTLYETMLASG
ncbi:MAG: glycosyltransferase family 4 protein [Rhodospirillales bacterium]